MQPIPGFVLEKGCKKQSILEDRISSMPDDILISILSQLPLKEAGRTSVLSRRWRYLWTFTGSLSFDLSGLRILMLCRFVKKSLKVERTRFVQWVKQVLKMHRGQTLDEFRICFDLDDKPLLDSWIDFALKRRVKRFQLNMSRFDSFRLPECTLTVQFLHNYNLDCLTELCLECVDLTDEVIRHILSCCPFLELLSLTRVRSLEHIIFPGPSLKLKCLEIVHCLALKDIQISAINLVSFKYRGSIITISVQEVPFLIEASFKGPFVLSLLKNCPLQSLLFSQLQSLSLDLSSTMQILNRFPNLPKLRNLRQLELRVDIFGLHSLLHFMSFLKICPLLHRFVLKIVGLQEFKPRSKASVLWRSKLLKAKCLHQCLKVVEFVGFVGCKVDAKLVRYVLENTRVLEKIIINTSCPYNVEHNLEKYDTRDHGVKQVARQRAKQLEAILPLGVELVIL